MTSPLDHIALDRAAELIHRSRRILVLTGAGISTNCGIPGMLIDHGIPAASCVADTLDRL